METYEESVELTRTFVKIESTNPGTEEAAMREAILAYLKDTSCEIQLDDVGNGRKCNCHIVAGKYKRRKYKRKIQRSSNVYIYLPYGYCRCRRGWTKNPFGAEIEEQNGILRMYGRGSCDMKSDLPVH